MVSELLACPKACEVLGKEKREKLAKERELRVLVTPNSLAAFDFVHGFAKRQELVASGQAKRNENSVRAAELENEIAKKKDLETNLKGLAHIKVLTSSAVSEAAEQPEKAAKEQFDKEWEGKCPHETVSLTHRADSSAKHKEESEASLFHKLDADQNGFITVSDIMTNIAFDSDQDGGVSLEEAEAMLDRDGDGALSETEASVSPADFDSLLNELPENLKVSL